MKKGEKKSKENAGNRGQELIELGKFYFLNQKYDAAIRDFEKALKIDPNNPEIYYNLGIVYEAKNMNEKAGEMYRRALELNPDYTFAKEHLDKLIGV